MNLKFLLLLLAASFVHCQRQGDSPGLDNHPASEPNLSCQLERKPKCCENNDNCFRAAVFEHFRDDSAKNSDWRKMASSNLKDFAEAAKKAASKNANIIVFPEDGILIGKREFLEPALPELGDPNNLNYTNNNPCKQADLFPGDAFEPVRQLSCIARENNLYVVANLGTKESCKGTEENCPKWGSFAFNTNLVFSPNGTLLKRYRKANLFVEEFDLPPQVDTIYFDTPLGRFGVFTCFDMLFKRPALDLVEKFHIDTLLFPTLWYDELPALSAIQYQDGWSDRHQVNLLAANRRNLATGSVGSGIYSGTYQFYTSASSSTNSKMLLVASIPKRPRELENCELDLNTKQLHLGDFDSTSKYLHKNLESIKSGDSVYILNKNEERKSLCKGQVCCTIDYKISERPSIYEKRLVLIARDGIRSEVFGVYEQLCQLATLETAPSENNSQEVNLKNITFASESPITFSKLALEGNFTTQYVYPIAGYSVGELVERTKRSFYCDYQGERQASCRFEFTGGDRKPVYSFGLFARPHERDEMPPGYPK